MHESLLRLPDVKLRTGLSRSTIYRAISEGNFPPPRKFGVLSLWPQSEIDAWVSAVLAGSVTKPVERGNPIAGVVADYSV